MSNPSEATEPVMQIIIKTDQRGDNIRVYHTRYPMALGQSQPFDEPSDLEHARDLPELGRAVALRLLALPGVTQVLLFNYQVWVLKNPSAVWAGPGGVDRAILISLARAIARALGVTKFQVRVLGSPPPAPRMNSTDDQAA